MRRSGWAAGIEWRAINWSNNRRAMIGSNELGSRSGGKGETLGREALRLRVVPSPTYIIVSATREERRRNKGSERMPPIYIHTNGIRCKQHVASNTLSIPATLA